LLIPRNEIAAHQEREQITKFPKGAEIDPEPVLIRPDSNFEVGFLRSGHAIVDRSRRPPNRSCFVSAETLFDGPVRTYRPSRE